MFHSKTIFFKKRFIFLFVALLFLYLLHPLSNKALVGMGLLDISFSLVLIMSLLAVSTKKHIALTSLFFGIVAQILSVAPYFGGGKPLMLVALAVDCIYLIYTAGMILFHVLKDKLVTTDTIFGSLCVYLLIGFIWALIYSFLEFAKPGSFQFNQSLTAQLQTGNRGAHIFSELYYLIYFSFATLTTLGYGDIVPASAWTRVFSAMEAIMGQLYLVVLVARLVGLHITQLRDRKES